MTYLEKLRIQFIELYVSAYGFKPANITVDNYMNKTPDMRHATRLKMEMVVNG